MKIKTAIIVLSVLTLFILGFFTYFYFIRQEITEIPKKTINVETKNGSKEVQLNGDENELQKIEDIKKEVLEQRKSEIISNLEEQLATTTLEDPEVKEEKINNMRKLLNK